jgi:polyferredoxin
MITKFLNRSFWQGLFLLTAIILAFLHTLDNIYPSAHGLCPFGGLVSLYSIVTTGTFIHRTHGSSLILLIAVIFTALLLGRVFCGWFCPLGTIGEWVYKIGRKLGLKKKIEFTGFTAALLKYLKFVVLAVLLYFTWTIGELFYKAWCPWSAFMTIFEPDELLTDLLFGAIFLLIIVGASLFIERFFCRYLCPLGASLAIFNRFSLIKPAKANSCKDCRQCEKVCPIGVEIRAGKKINDMECIRCYKCIDECREPGLLTFNFKSLQIYQAGLLAFLVFGLTIFTGQQLGYWEKGRTLTQGAGMGIEQNPDASESFDNYISGENRGLEKLPAELADLSGQTTINDLSAITGLTPEAIIILWGLHDDYPADTNLRQVMTDTGLARTKLLEMLLP